MGSLSILITIATLPVILILMFIYTKDKNKEPLKLLLQLFGLGIFSVILVLLFTLVLKEVIPFINKDLTKMNFMEVLIYSFVVVALVEEFFKWLMVYKFGYKNKNYDEKYDIIVYSVFVSLGFALFENLIYVISEYSIGVGIFRGLLSVPGHACNAIFMGYFLSLTKIYKSKGDNKNAQKNLVLSIIVPTLLHGIYDFCLMISLNIFYLLFFVFIINLYKISLKKLEELAESSTENQKQQFCSNCGKLATGNFCGNCGTKQV